jgi:hypothetical protein
MGVHRWAYALGFFVAASVAAGALAHAASGGEFYSWIDPSGTMVMTDDPSKIPPPTQRSEVQVHKFSRSQPSVSKASVARQPASVESSDPSVEKPATAPVAGREASRGAAVDPNDLDLPTVMLEPPADGIQSQYVWVPLTAPIYLRSGTVSGFWCHRQVKSPVDAFTQFLRTQLQKTAANQPIGVVAWPPTGMPSGSSAMSAQTPYSGNTVYDQVMRERQALNDRIVSQSTRNTVYDQVMRERQAFTSRIASQFPSVTPSPAPSSGASQAGSGRSGAGR